MTKLLFHAAMLAVLAVSGCAIAQDTERDVGTSLQEGLTGQGRIVSPDQTSDAFGPEYQ